VKQRRNNTPQSFLHCFFGSALAVQFQPKLSNLFRHRKKAKRAQYQHGFGEELM
jgi:hypothetical protein